MLAGMPICLCVCGHMRIRMLRQTLRSTGALEASTAWEHMEQVCVGAM